MRNYAELEMDEAVNLIRRKWNFTGFVIKMK